MCCRGLMGHALVLLVLIQLVTCKPTSDSITLSIGPNGETFYVAASTDTPFTWSEVNGGICGPDTPYRLAVIQDSESYNDLKDQLAQLNNGNPAQIYHIGLVKPADTSVFVIPPNGAQVAPFHDLTENLLKADEICVGISSDGNMVSDQCNVDGLYICTEKIVPCPSCIDAVVLDPSPPDSCYWNPISVSDIANKRMARSMCDKNGGTLFLPRSAPQVTQLVADEIIVDGLSYFTDFTQIPGSGVPQWEGYLANDSLWANTISFGTSLHPYDYTVVYYNGELDLISNVNDASAPCLTQCEASVLCEATFEDFCMANTPEIPNGDKEYVEESTEIYVSYECDEGYRFPDFDEHKEIACNCSLEALSDNIHEEELKCILINLCEDYDDSDDEAPCENGMCIFNNKPGDYTCICSKGYKLDYDANCQDINECEDPDNECPQNSEKGGCVNTPGGYWCFCQNGYGWDKYRRCTPLGDLTAKTLTLGVCLKIDYGDYTEGGSDDYEELYEAIHELILECFGYEATLEELKAKPSFKGLELNIVLGASSSLSVKEQSVLAYKFYKTITDNGGVYIDSDRVQICGEIYFQNSLIMSQISITSLCFLYTPLQLCGYGSCSSEGNNGPFCECKEDYYGEFCEKEDTKEPPSTIGLIVAVVILFIIVIVLFIWVCCLCCHMGRREHTNRKPPCKKSCDTQLYFPSTRINTCPQYAITTVPM